MPKQHTVQKGETLSKIAKQYQINDWRMLYNHPDNAPLREKRKNPNIIHPGDIVVIPDTQEQTMTIRTGQHHRFVVKPDVPMPAPSWLKVRALYDDPWQTPLTDGKVNVSVEGLSIAELQPLQTGTGKNTLSMSAKEAKSTAKEPGTLLLEEVPLGDAEVEFARELGLEQEISTTRKNIEARLNKAYLELLQNMSEFQKQWDDYGVASIAISEGEGLYAGASEWIEDQSDLFKAQTWKDLGNQISDAAGNTWDTAVNYSKSQYEQMRKQVAAANQWIDKNDENLFNWSWWSQNLDEAVDQASGKAVRMVDDIKKDIAQAQQLLNSSIATSEKVYKHRNAILNFHKDIASGDIARIEQFIDTVLMDIDPALAKEIKNNPEWSAVLELIADHDSILVYLSYISLFLEAVPPNFYAYIASKGGAYVILEAIVLIICTLLTEGAATAGRLAMLSARLSAGAAKVGKVGQKIKKGLQAIKAFTNMLDEFVEAAQDLRGLGKKLRKARTGGRKFKGKPGSTVEAKKKHETRVPKCQTCGKQKDKTKKPSGARRKKGIVEYV